MKNDAFGKKQQRDTGATFTTLRIVMINEYIWGNFKRVYKQDGCQTILKHSGKSVRHNNSHSSTPVKLTRVWIQ